jgi:hypothetical protein
MRDRERDFRVTVPMLAWKISEGHTPKAVGCQDSAVWHRWFWVLE